MGRSEPEPQAGDPGRIGNRLVLRPRQIGGLAIFAGPLQAHIGRQLTADLIAQAQTQRH